MTTITQQLPNRLPSTVEAGIIAADFYCQECGEPVAEGAETCPWCAINKEHEYAASRGNPMRMLAQVGLLDDYYKSMNEIGKSKGE